FGFVATESKRTSALKFACSIASVSSCSWMKIRLRRADVSVLKSPVQSRSYPVRTTRPSPAEETPNESASLHFGNRRQWKEHGGRSIAEYPRGRNRLRGGLCWSLVSDC